MFYCHPSNARLGNVIQNLSDAKYSTKDCLDSLVPDVDEPLIIDFRISPQEGLPRNPFGLNRRSHTINIGEQTRSVRQIFVLLLILILTIYSQIILQESTVRLFTQHDSTLRYTILYLCLTITRLFAATQTPPRLANPNL